MKFTPRKAILLFAVLCYAVVLFGVFALADAAEVSFDRDRQHEWRCSDDSNADCKTIQ